MRSALICALLGMSLACSAQELLRVARLDDIGSGLERLLMRLERGDLTVLETAPAWLFTAALTRGASQNDGVVHHWHRDLLALLAGLDPAARTRVLAALDRHEDHANPATAMRLLPAPSAIASLAAAADRAFDRGRLADYLQIALLLDQHDPNWEHAPGRRAAATDLLGLGGPNGPRIGVPGPLLIQSHLPPVIDLERGHQVRWVQEHGHLLACDPWLQVRWQRPLEHHSRVYTGAGGALVRQQGQILLITEAGTLREFPLPRQARILGVRGGQAWFAVDNQVYGRDFVGDGARSFDLGSPALGPPLIQGDSSLWLTGPELILVADDTIKARARHGLPLGDWRLLLTQRGPALSDGSTHYLIAAAEPDSAPSPMWIEQLSRLGRSDLALLALRAADAADTQSEAFAEARALALLTSEPEPNSSWTPADPDRALQLLVQRAGGQAALRADPALRAAAAVNADARCPGPQDDPRDHPSRWSLLQSGAGLAQPLTPAGLSLAPGVEQPAPEAFVAIRHPLLGAVRSNGHLAVQLRQDIDHLVLSASHANSGALLWRARFPAAGFFLPGLGLRIAGDTVLVVEGQTRLHGFGLSTGERLIQLRKPADWPLVTLCPLSDGRVAHLSADRNVVAVLGPEGLRQHQLEQAARYLVSKDAALVVVTATKAYRLGDETALNWPEALRAGSVPAQCAQGLFSDGRLWRWIR
ncbi:MAG: hypothetical protein PF961_13340 [Planctomycetota bacterium]|jgi:hypothetical protein|nr:hypothetical protein [Planctomycetota bacterium]